MTGERAPRIPNDGWEEESDAEADERLRKELGFSSAEEMKSEIAQMKSEDAGKEVKRGEQRKKAEEKYEKERPHYTEADLVAAKAELTRWRERWANDRSMNPNKFRSQINSAATMVAVIQASLDSDKESGNKK